jgi:hypothetical protein
MLHGSSFSVGYLFLLSFPHLLSAPTPRFHPREATMSARLRSSPLLLVLPLLPLLGACASDLEPFARARVIASLDDAIGGAKAVAREGDFLLENDRIRVAVLAGGGSMGPGLFGGSLVDADLRRWSPEFTSGQGNDLFNESFPTVNMNVPAAADEGAVTLLNDGSNGEPAVVRVTAPATGFLTVLNALWGIMGVNSFQFVHDYILEPGVPYLRMRTVVTAGTGEPATEADPIPTATEDMPLLEYALESGMVIGDFFLSGGSVDVFVPGIGFDEGGAVFAATNAGRNTFKEPFVADYIANAGDGVSYGIAPLEGTLLIPMFTSDQTAAVGGGTPGDGTGRRFQDGVAFSYERVFAVGQGDVGSVYDAILEARGASTGQVRGHVLERSTLEPVSDAEVVVYRGRGSEREKAPWVSWRTDVGLDEMPDGSFGGKLPPGSYTLVTHQKGRPTGEPVAFDLAAGQELTMNLGLPRAGAITVNVTDEAGLPVPAKLTVLSSTGVSVRQPDFGDKFLSGGATEIFFAPDGTGTATLPPGEYQVIASRGPEYELGWSPLFILGERDRVQLDLQVLRSVDTEGWVAADLHVHHDVSFDSGISAERRIASMAGEGVEFFLSTDHDYIDDYAPDIEIMGMEPWVRSEVGVEITTLEAGHFIAFPLAADHLAEAGGAFDWTDMSPDEILDAARALGRPGAADPILLVPHARDGILGYFDQFGLDPYTAANGDVVIRRPTLSFFNPILTSENFSLDFDAMEILNAKRFELIRSPTQSELDAWAAGGDGVDGYDFIERTLIEQAALRDGLDQLGYGIKGHLDDWFLLLNLGYRITALGNSDSHDATDNESGCARNYVASTTDDPAFIDSAEIAQAIRDHAIVVSTGPFVRFEIDGAGVGSELVAHGPVPAHIEVLSPTWYDVDRVELYENGTLIEEWRVPQGRDVVDFYADFEIKPQDDSWYVVVTMGDDSLFPVATPVDRPQTQLQDVVADALSAVSSLKSMVSEPIPRPRGFPVYPYAVTNPIWVDMDGNGWRAPGLPTWLRTPVENESK